MHRYKEADRHRERDRAPLLIRLEISQDLFILTIILKPEQHHTDSVKSALVVSFKYPVEHSRQELAQLICISCFTDR